MRESAAKHDEDASAHVRMSRVLVSAGLPTMFVVREGAAYKIIGSTDTRSTVSTSCELNSTTLPRAASS
jgi:hypothetical protein